MTSAIAEQSSHSLFPSMAELRAVHRELLDQHHTNTDTGEMRLAIEEFVARARESGRLIHDEEHRYSAQSVIDYWVTALYRARVEVRKTTLETFDPELSPKLKDEACPYVGLRPFDETKKDLFFGRTRVLEAVISLLQTERLISVIGPSGTGKSSLVSGGLVPALRRDAIPESSTWRFLGSIVPGADPLKSLTRILKPADFIATDEWTLSEIRKLRESPSYLHDSLTASEKTTVFLVVDQFEELFTLCGNENERQAFAASLAALVQYEDARHTVVITVRSDYETHLVQLTDLEALVRTGEIRIGALNANELREAIEAPARLVGLQFDYGLVDAMIDETLGEPAALPLLQYALRELWDERDRNRLTFEKYNELGGALQALATRANAIYKGFDEEHRICAKRIFLRLIRPGDGLENMSRRMSKADLIAGENHARADFVLEQLRTEGLLRVTEGATDEDTYIELAHEALARNWQLLMSWLDQQRVHILTRDRLQAAAQEWVERGRAAGLLDKAQTEDAERWLLTPEAADLGPTALLREFVRASREQLDLTAAREAAIRRRGFWLVVALTISVVAILIVWLRLTVASRNAALDQADAALAKANEVRATAAAALARNDVNEVKADFRQFMNATTVDKVVILRERVVKPLEAERDALMVQIASLTAQNEKLKAEQTAQKTVTTSGDQALVTQIGDLTAKLTDLNRQLEEVKSQLEKETSNHSETRQLLAAAQTKLNSIQPPPRLLPFPKDEKLTIGQRIGPAILCCFFKTLGSDVEFFTTAASAVEGEPGDPVVLSKPDGSAHRIGVIWKFVGSHQTGAVIVTMLPGIGRDPSVPGIKGIWKLDNDVEPNDTVKVLYENGVVRGKVAQQDRQKFTVTGFNAPIMVGAPVFDDDDDLIGMVVESYPERLLVMTVETYKKAGKMEFVPDL
jgi:hypothetical protein